MAALDSAYGEPKERKELHCRIQVNVCLIGERLTGSGMSLSEEDYQKSKSAVDGITFLAGRSACSSCDPHSCSLQAFLVNHVGHLAVLGIDNVYPFSVVMPEI